MIEYLTLDFNGDQLINGDDVEQVVQALTRNELNQDEISIVREKVLEEADIDDDKCISFSEFRHVISRAPEFLKWVNYSIALYYSCINQLILYFSFGLFTVHFICESNSYRLFILLADLFNSYLIT